MRLDEAFRRIAQGEEGLFLANHILVDSRGFIRKGRDSAVLSIREFREKMRLESEIADIEGELKTKASQLDELQLSQKELEQSRHLVTEKKKSRQGTLAATEREAIDVGAQIRTVRERLNETASRAEPAAGQDDAADSTRTSEARTACEAEKIEVEQGLLL